MLLECKHLLSKAHCSLYIWKGLITLLVMLERHNKERVPEKQLICKLLARKTVVCSVLPLSRLPQDWKKHLMPLITALALTAPVCFTNYAVKQNMVRLQSRQWG